ncbi:MAG: site-specific integrase [Planctomycetes bacterium]|nr:site-specific integrase [Planctomycetota bacterium]
MPVRRMPRLGRCVTRAFVHVAKKRYYLGSYDDPAVQELYARLTGVWERTGHIDLSLIQEARHTTTDHRTTIAELGLKFRHYAEQRYVHPDGTLSTELHNFRTAWRIVREMFGSTPAADFGPRKLREVQSAMAQKRKPNGDCWSRSNVNKQTSRVRLIFDWAVAEEIIPETVAAALHRVRGLRRGEQDVRESEAVTPASQAEVDAVKPLVSRQVWALIQLQLLTGARSGELLYLRPIDLQNAAGPVWIVELGEHKTAHHGKTRTLYFGPHAQEVLQPFLADRPVDKPLFSPLEAEYERRGTTDYNSQRSPGEHYTAGSYRRAIRYACMKLHPYPNDIKRAADEKRLRKEHRERWCWHPHQLRHNYATMIRKRFGVEEASNMLDHSSVKMTEVYAERDREQALEIAQLVG